MAPTLREANAEIVLAVDPDPGALRRVAALAAQVPRLVLTGRLTRQDLLSSAPDAVIISSPSGLHYEHGMTALTCGLPTFVEKPLACTATNARRLQRAAQRRLFASDQRTYREDLRRLRSLIQAGHLGSVLEIKYHDSVIPAPHFASTWRNDPRLAGGGVLLDLGYHTAGAMYWLLDLPEENFKITAARLRRGTLQVEEQADITCVAGRIQAQLDIRLVERDPREILRIRGSLGKASIIRKRRKPPVAQICIQLNRDEPQRYQIPLDERSDSQSLRDFLHGRSGTGQLERHIKTLEFLELAYDHAEGERRVLSDAAD